MDNAPEKIINGFCYIDGPDMVFVSLYDESRTRHSVVKFNDFIKSNDITDQHLILANEEVGIVTPLYKNLLINKLTKKPDYPRLRTKDELIDVCYNICIKHFQKK